VPSQYESRVPRLGLRVCITTVVDLNNREKVGRKVKPAETELTTELTTKLTTELTVELATFIFRFVS
jgi:hypothetical protein